MLSLQFLSVTPGVGPTHIKFRRARMGPVLLTAVALAPSAQPTAGIE